MLRLLWGLANLLYLLVILMVSQFTARSLTRPLADLERLAESVGPGQWDVRLPYRRKDEVGALVDGFNRMSTRLAEATERLVEAERTAAWQQTARTIAHGIKNTLAPVKLALARLPEQAQPDEQNSAAGKPLETVRSELDRLERIARDFSLFGRPIDIQPLPAEPNSIVQQAVRLSESFAPAAGIDMELAPGLPPISIDPYMLREALVNLLKNAREAAGPDGRVAIATAATGVGVRIEVRDDGPGIPPEIEQRLFDPYVTTKPSGSGLGLAIVKKIVGSLGGRIAYRTGNTGTTFSLDWNAADDDATG